MVEYTTMEQDGYLNDFLYGKPVFNRLVWATKQKGNPDITRGIDFCVAVGWRAIPSECGTFLRSSIPIFTLNFSAN